MTIYRPTSAIALVALLGLVSACSGEKAVDNTVDASLFVGKAVVKGTVGAGKLAVKGAKAAVGSE